MLSLILMSSRRIRDVDKTIILGRMRGLMHIKMSRRIKINNILQISIHLVSKVELQIKDV